MIAAVDPGDRTAESLVRAEAEGASLRGCTVFAFGKAAGTMARAAIELCAPRQGIVLGPRVEPLLPLRSYRAAHPDPADDAAERAEEVLAMARSLGPTDVALCLISGGGSAMFEGPVAGVRLDELRVTARLLREAGADIEELNAVRRHLSDVKGGKLAAALEPALVVNLILSDVPGHPPSVVASGPTLAAPSGPDPLAVVRRYGVELRLPAAVRARLVAPVVPATQPASGAARTYVVADNRTARAALVRAMGELGLRVEDEPGFITGEAREAGSDFVRRARARCDERGLDAVVGGGETTVRVRGSGRGGRNQELVLAAARELEGEELVLGAGTDGVDGSSDAAGAWADAALWPRARARGLDPADFLARNDSDPFFRQMGGRLVTGPTGTNVADVCLYLRSRSSGMLK